MKKRFSLMLVLILVLSLAIVGCSKKDDKPSTGDTPATNDVANEDETDDDNEVAEGEIDTDATLIIGDTTELASDWEGSWQNNASNIKVMDLIGGYGVVTTDLEGNYLVNETVVKDYEVTENEDGSKTYTWTIADDLVYNNGEAITAKDYVANHLIFASELVGEMGGYNTSGQELLGWSEYSSGETNKFAGVRLLDDYKFSLTIAAENLPQYYELQKVAIGPASVEFYLGKDIDVLDDGDGAYFAEDLTVEAFQEPLNAARYAIPRVTAGPYYLDSYDEAASQAIVKINDKYKGDYLGRKPQIATVVLKKVVDKTMFDELEAGQVDLLNGIMQGEAINTGLDLVEGDKGIAYTTYPRAGYGKLQFVCDVVPTNDVEVRQAIAHLLDRNEFANTFTGGFGSAVNGPYGEGQWFYQRAKANLNKNLNAYAYSVDKAIELLESAGWVLDADGNEYTSGIRHKKQEDGSITPLIIKWASTENNEMSELLKIKLAENPDVEKVGMKIEQDVMTFPELMNYRGRNPQNGEKYTIPTYNMMNLATNWYPNYNLTSLYTTDPAEVARGFNTNFLIDEELDMLTNKLNNTEPGNEEQYVKNFEEMVTRWNYLLPDLPLYSNIIHDFYSDKLVGFESSAFSSIVDSVLGAHMVK